MNLDFFRTLAVGVALGLFAQPAIANETDNLAELQSARAALNGGDFQAAAQILSPLAEAGDAWAKNALAGLYLRGLGVERDTSKGVDLLGEAASLGNVDAQFNLGVLYLEGIGVSVDERTAARFFLQAANQGLADAQFELGNILASGRFEGEPSKITVLGKRDTNPTRIPDDDFASVEWYRKAASQGHAGAQYNLGLSYYHGRGVPQNFAEAFRHYRQAAVQGLASAQTNLAFLYGAGEGTTKNAKLAYMWSLVAAASGDEVALRNREIFANDLSENEKTIVQARAKTCLDTSFAECD